MNMQMEAHMQLRTITAGAREDDIAQAARAAQVARTRLEAAGYTVQSLRLAVTLAANTCGDFAMVARGVEERALDAGFDFVSLGLVDAQRLPALAEAIGTTQTVFASAQIATPEGIVLPDMIRAAAEAIVALGRAAPDGFGNLRFAALACVGAGSPFLPAAYHDRGEPWLAVGPEGAALAVEATLEQEDKKTRRQEDKNILTTRIEQHDAQIVATLDGLQAETGVRFAGCDWSLAPRPGAETSIGAAIEALSGVPFGAWGTLAAVRALTAAVRAARVTQLGFSGVMLPVLEDTVLAQRNAEGCYTLRDLLAFSAVCGTGLDTIPLAEDITAAQVAGVLAEVAALAATYRKPLTARLMPMPGLKAGDMTRFDLSANPDMARYFVPTRAMVL